MIYSIAEYAHSPSWSPDGSWIAITISNYPNSKIIAIDPDGEYDPITIFERNQSVCNMAWIP